MPLVTVQAAGPGACGIDIYYEVHGAGPTDGPTDGADNRPRCLMLMGFGATGHVWCPQLADMLTAQDDSGESPMLVCILDNRGVGRSSCPARCADYSTEVMARDALAVMDHLGWTRFHLVGHSMGSMIACRVGALAPQRVLSLSLISGTGGRWQAVPQTAAALWLGIKKMFVRSVRGRAAVDVQFHFSPSLLEEVDAVTKKSRRETLISEYVESYMEEEQSDPSPGHGFRGQMAAVLKHRLRKRDVKSIQLGQFPIQVIHGRQDILALPKYGARLAERLAAPCILLEGGHFVIREQAAAVNALLRAIVLGTSFANVERYPYMPFRHWVEVVEQHRLAAAARRAQRAQQAQQQQQQAEGPGGQQGKGPWPLQLRLWGGAERGQRRWQSEQDGGSPQGASPQRRHWSLPLLSVWATDKVQQGEQQRRQQPGGPPGPGWPEPSSGGDGLSAAEAGAAVQLRSGAQAAAASGGGVELMQWQEEASWPQQPSTSEGDGSAAQPSTFPSQAATALDLAAAGDTAAVPSGLPLATKQLDPDTAAVEGASTAGASTGAALSSNMQRLAKASEGSLSSAGDSSGAGMQPLLLGKKTV